jgi:hypothetical protein
MKSTGGGGGQIWVDLQNAKIGMILFLLYGCNFAWLPFEFEQEFAGVALGKVVHLDVVLDEVQRFGIV